MIFRARTLGEISGENSTVNLCLSTTYVDPGEFGPGRFAARLAIKYLGSRLVEYPTVANIAGCLKMAEGVYHIGDGEGGCRRGRERERDQEMTTTTAVTADGGSGGSYLPVLPSRRYRYLTSFFTRRRGVETRQTRVNTKRCLSRAHLRRPLTTTTTTVVTVKHNHPRAASLRRVL